MLNPARLVSAVPLVFSVGADQDNVTLVVEDVVPDELDPPPELLPLELLLELPPLELLLLVLLLLVLLLLELLLLLEPLPVPPLLDAAVLELEELPVAAVIVPTTTSIVAAAGLPKLSAPDRLVSAIVKFLPAALLITGTSMVLALVSPSCQLTTPLVAW